MAVFEGGTSGIFRFVVKFDAGNNGVTNGVTFFQ